MTDMFTKQYTPVQQPMQPAWAFSHCVHISKK